MSAEPKYSQVQDLRQVTEEVRKIYDHLNTLLSLATEVVEFVYEGGSTQTVQLQRVVIPRAVGVGHCRLRDDDGTAVEALGVSWRFTPSTTERAITVESINNLTSGTHYRVRLVVVGEA